MCVAILHVTLWKAGTRLSVASSSVSIQNVSRSLNVGGRAGFQTNRLEKCSLNISAEYRKFHLSNVFPKSAGGRRSELRDKGLQSDTFGDNSLRLLRRHGRLNCLRQVDPEYPLRNTRHKGKPR